MGHWMKEGNMYIERKGIMATLMTSIYPKHQLLRALHLNSRNVSNLGPLPFPRTHLSSPRLHLQTELLARNRLRISQGRVQSRVTGP